MVQSWHTKKERKLIKRFGGTPRKSYGVDGMIDGKPVEVRVAKKDDRFRLGKEVHQELVSEGGSYLFDKVGDGKPPKQVSARRVDDMIDGGTWMKDRNYPHDFLKTDQIF